MRLAFICNEFPPRQHGGIGTFVKAIVPELARRGHSVEVLEFGSAESIGERHGATVRALRTRGTSRGRWIVDRWRLKKACERLRFDIVETSDFEGWLPWGLRGIPVVSRLHQSGTSLDLLAGRRPRRSVCWRERATLGASEAWIAVSEASLARTRATFPGLSSPRIRTIFCPVQTELEGQPLARPIGPFLLFAGYVSRSKGVDRLARVVAPVLRSHPELQLVLAGRVMEDDGKPEGMKQVVLGELGQDLAGRVEFLGFVDRANLHELMRRATAFVFPSRLETFGLVVGEAMKLGCPVIVPNEPPFTEYVEHGATGLLCGTDDEWTASIRRVVEDKTLRASLIEAGRTFAASTFTVERCVDETLAFYEELLASRRTRKA